MRQNGCQGPTLFGRQYKGCAAQTAGSASWREASGILSLGGHARGGAGHSTPKTAGDGFNSPEYIGFSRPLRRVQRGARLARQSGDVFLPCETASLGRVSTARPIIAALGIAAAAALPPAFAAPASSPAMPVASASAVRSNQAPKEWSWWVGHQVTRGHRKVPVLGKLSTHLETYYLAKMRRKGQGFEVVQQACGSKYRPIAGVKVGFHAEHTPALHYNFQPNQKGELRATTKVNWTREDLDRDGEPGLSIDVNAKICRGRLYVGNRSRLQSMVRWTHPWQWDGEIQTEHTMQILGSDSFCLRTFARSRKEQARGRFRFKAIPGPTSCAKLLKKPWPVHAEASSSAKTR